MLQYLVTYASETGNTKKIADEIYRTLPNFRKEILNIRQWNGQYDSETYFIGFWVNHGTCSLEIIDLLSSLHGKNIALFGTCGLGNTPEYYRKIEKSALTWLPDDNHFLGSYFCQGCMPQEIRQKYELCRGKCDETQLNLMIKAYEEAKFHPNRQDLLRANIFASEVITVADKIQGR
ncbi:flavodoxin family protein BilS [Butyrivibrio sp. NC3005]|uniref:flavodoxin family protein BilS n=1 Tax=Butyrivibrio sp. NC3005 TaxID=1280685 RepID=UPI000408CFEF|nr:flavodoxin family protein BilS [Butyrivibrio sp. NC3005]